VPAMPPGVFSRVMVRPPPGLSLVPPPPAPEVQRQSRRKAKIDKANGIDSRRFLLSAGSKNHTIGKCRPCKYLSQGAACPFGEKCNFCHEEHDDGKVVESNLYSVQAQLRRIVEGAEKVAVQATSDVSTCASTAAPSTSGSPRLVSCIERVSAVDEPCYAPLPMCLVSAPPGLSLMDAMPNCSGEVQL
jgi:hypothetical protein